ncbi:hypothetical protein [Reichenbachiella versicolor]|uniref:hypothetical protein n=1 Tax=Reichenbachiella versicolor TaxID=1821036 RepID=UPI000D6E0681|nr:hypothetical protein [Reichenbachiella versicolor]
MTKLKMCFIAWIMSMIFSPTSNAQDDTTNKELTANVVSRYPDAQVKQVTKRYGTTYDVKFMAKLPSDPSRTVKASALYSLKKAWMRDEFHLGKKLPEKIQKQMHKLNKSYKHSIYTVSKNLDPYYTISLNNNRFEYFDANQKHLKIIPLKEGLAPSSAILKDMASRFENPEIKGGWVKSAGVNMYIVVFDTEEQEGRIANVKYKNGQWVNSVVNMLNYDKLPFEMMMYVSDNGGIEKFKAISKTLDQSGVFYKIKYKNGKVIKLDENLEELKNGSVSQN